MIVHDGSTMAVTMVYNAFIMSSQWIILVYVCFK